MAAGTQEERKPEESSTMDFAANIEKVKEVLHSVLNSFWANIISY